MVYRFSCGSKKGIALILVIVALVLLLLVGIPFAASMRVWQQRTGNQLSQTRARFAAEGAFEHALAALGQTQATFERYGRQLKPFDNPDYDSLTEFRVSPAIAGLTNQNPRGEIWSLSVEDEQGKINLNSATPGLLGNLLASAIVTRAVTETDTAIEVDSTVGFPLQNGYLWVFGELIQYAQAGPKRFSGCQRGLYQNSPDFRGPRSLSPGTLLIDARAFRICRHRTLARPGFLRDYRTVEEVKSISDSGTCALSAEEFEQISPALTVHSLRYSSGWLNPQLILNNLPSDDPQRADVAQISEATFFAPGLVVKLEGEGRVEYAMALGISANSIILDRHLRNTFTAGQSTIAVLEPHPININSASPKVLFALFKGLTSSSDWIDRKEASILTRAILARRAEDRPIQSPGDFHLFLKDLQKSLQELSEKDESGDRLALSNADLDALRSTAQHIAGQRLRFAGITGAPTQGFGRYQVPFPLTAPFLYHSLDLYTIEAIGVINTETGVELARHRLQRVVNAVPQEPLRWFVENQREMQNFLDRLPSYRVISGPKMVAPPEVFPDENRNDGWVALDTACLLQPSPQGTTGGSLQSWNDTYEGIEIPAASPNAVGFRISGVEMLPGALSFWVRFPQGSSAGRRTLFDMAEKAWENRLCCYLEDGELILRLCDATTEPSAAEMGARVNFEKDVWYHLTTVWHGTGPDALALFVDGEPVGEFRHRLGDTTTVSAFLTRPVKAADLRLPLTSAAGFAPQGVIAIGDEIIEYERSVGNELYVREKYDGFTIERTPARGARGTTARDHPSGARVSIFGYSDSFNDRLFPATLLQDEVPSADTYATMKITPKKDPNTGKMITGLQASDTEIPVSGTDGFLQNGYLVLIDPTTTATERVFYQGLTGAAFTSVSRGQFGDSAQNFANGSYVLPLSISVDDQSEYPESGFLQIEDEWVEYADKVDTQYFVFLLTNVSSLLSNFQKTGSFLPNYRGAMGTQATSHPAGEKVLPVFRTRQGSLGRDDIVTLIKRLADGKETKEENMVNWAYQDWAALIEDVKNTYEPALGTRVLKFPSGERPSQITPLVWGRSALDNKTGVGQFTLDELFYVELSARKYILARAVSANEKTLTLQATGGLPADAGLLKIGEEYIAYRTIASPTLTDLERGWLQSKPTAHATGTELYPMLWLALSKLEKGISAEEAEIPLSDIRDFPAEGYILCGSEVIGYLGKKGPATLSMPQSRLNQGLMRGSFGSRSAAHAAGEMARVLPHRYWDRQLPEYDGRGQAYFQAARTAPGARWGQITWQEQLPQARDQGLRLLARLDGQPTWDTPPTNRPDGLFQFDNAQGPNRLQARGDTLEVRVFFVYKEGAYSSGAWKATPRLTALYADYLQPIVVQEAR